MALNLRDAKIIQRVLLEVEHFSCTDVDRVYAHKQKAQEYNIFELFDYLQNSRDLEWLNDACKSHVIWQFSLNQDFNLFDTRIREQVEDYLNSDGQTLLTIRVVMVVRWLAENIHCGRIKNYFIYQVADADLINETATRQINQLRDENLDKLFTTSLTEYKDNPVLMKKLLLGLRGLYSIYSLV